MTALIVMLGIIFLWTEMKPIVIRLVELEETKARPAAPIVPNDPIPSDMMAHALSYPEAWAREQAVSRLRELYNDCGSWDAVRNVWAIEFEN